MDHAVCIARWIVEDASVFYTPLVMPTARIAKTLASLKSGALTPPALHRSFLVGGMGDSCRGCGERIASSEKAYYVRIAGSDFFGLHLVCHETWIRFKYQRT